MAALLDDIAKAMTLETRAADEMVRAQVRKRWNCIPCA